MHDLLIPIPDKHCLHPLYSLNISCVSQLKSVPCRLRYSIHLWDLKHPGTWESKGTYVYYTDFIMELAMLFLDLIHHIHMLVRRRGTSVGNEKVVCLTLFVCSCCSSLCLPKLFGNIWLSMASLVIFMQLRYLFHEVQRRVRRHKNYLRVINNMEARWIPMNGLDSS